MMGKISQITAARGGKALVALWALTLVILLATPIVTWLSNRTELMGNIAFSLLLAAVLIDASNVLSCIVETEGIRIAKAAWIGLCVVALFFVLGVADPSRPDTAKDAETILAYLMLILSFPIGFLSVLLLIGLGFLFNLEEAGFYISNLIAWLVFVVFGYLQWFKFTPYLIGKLRARKKASPA